MYNVWFLSCEWAFFNNYIFIDTMQSVDIVKYTDDEYEKYLNDPVGTTFNCTMQPHWRLLRYLL